MIVMETFTSVTNILIVLLKHSGKNTCWFYTIKNISTCFISTSGLNFFLQMIFVRNVEKINMFFNKATKPTSVQSVFTKAKNSMKKRKELVTQK